ncbi:MAG: Crp/Fnr family transcriptional regulator [Salinivirgaceae bacterium]|jgi:CRP-like cAMP-binding protein
MYHHIANSPVFKGLTPDTIETLLKSVQFRIKNVNEQQVIAQREDECTNLILIVQGSVRGEMLDYSGKILKVEDIYAPRPIAAAFLFGQNNRYPVDVVSNEDTTLLVIPKDSVLKMFQQSDVFLKNYLNAISNRAQFLSQRIWFLSFKTIKEKLAQYILNLANANGNKITLPLTQKELAEYFGVTRPSLARALGELEKDQIIEAKGKEIIIINRKLLIQLLN